MTEQLDFSPAPSIGPDQSGSASDAETAGTLKKTTRRKRMPMSGWCEAGNHHCCPHLMRAHRFTAKGTELRELVCPCRCHNK